jgi:hypothetical protein
MSERGLKSKGEKQPRRSPRKRGKTCGRPFKAPRPVADTVERVSAVVLQTTDTDSQVAELGEVIKPSSEDGTDIRQDTPPQTTLQSDIAVSDEEGDDVPIAATLPGKPQAATQPKKRKVSRVKNSWVYEPAISSASSYWDSSLSYARVLDRPDYCEKVADEGNVLVTAKDVTGTSPKRTEALPAEDDDASSGSDESEAYALPKKISKPKRVQAKQQKKPKKNKDKDIMSDVSTSEGEGSENDMDDNEPEVPNKKRPRKSSTKKKHNDLSAHVMPLPGEKTVASEAFGKLTSPQKKMVADRVNKTTKKVKCFHPRPSVYFQLCMFFFVFALGCS